MSPRLGLASSLVCLASASSSLPLPCLASASASALPCLDRTALSPSLNMPDDVQVRRVVEENAALREKLLKLRDYLVTSETEQQTNRDKMMMMMMDEQPDITQLTDNIDVITQVREQSLICTY